MPLTASERRQRGRIAGYALAAKHDSRQYTAAGRAAFLARFLDEVDPDRILPEPERIRRAEAAKKAYFARLALKSAQARSAAGLRRQAAELLAEAAELEAGTEAK